MEEKDDKHSFFTLCSERNSGNTNGKWVQCIDCERKLWLSDSTLRAIMYNHPELEEDKVIMKPVCAEHGFKRFKEDSEASVEPNIYMKPSPEQISEVVNAIRKKDNEQEESTASEDASTD